MILKRTGYALALGTFILAAAAALRYAEGADMLGADAARRTMQVLIGLILAAYANFMPKQIGSARSSPLAESRAQATLRVGGWSMTVAGLIYAGLWAFAPLSVADIVSMIAVAGALALTLGYAVWSFTLCGKGPDASVGR